MNPITSKRGKRSPAISYVERIATNCMQKLGATFRISRSGTPHILVDIAGVFYSCCYFGSTDTWRIFWPSMVFVDSQNKITFNRSPNMIAWLECEKVRLEGE